jgi:RNA recognition motif-containing protein
LITCRPSPKVQPIITDKLFVGNLGDANEQDIRELFEACGRLDTVKLHYDSLTGRSKGFALVVFRATRDAKFAIEKLHGYKHKGKKVFLFRLILD